MSSLQKLIAENAESAETFFNKIYCSAYSAVSAIKNLFAVES
jgi:isocitrate dehydrogenase kinase/phosphatase